MKVLVNYDKAEQAYLPVLQWHLRNSNIQALAVSSSLTIEGLLTKIQQTKVDAVVCCNAGTLANLVPGSSPSLDDYRGSILKYEVPVLVINSLAHTQTVDHGTWLLGKDLEKLKTYKTEMEKVPAFEFETLLDPSIFHSALETLSSAILIAYDIETYTIGGTTEKELKDGTFPITEKMPEVGETLITCCTWSAILPSGKIKTYVLPFIDFGVVHWTEEEDYIAAISLLREVNKLPVPKVMHNGMYDSTHSIVYHAEPRNWFLDTMALFHAEFSSLPKTLDFVSSIYLPDYIQWKNESSSASKNKDIERYWAYNAKDAFYTLRICLAQLKKMPAYAKANYAKQFPMVYPSLYCNFEGFKVDIDVRNKLRKEALAVLETNLAQLQVLTANPSFNPGSWQQVAYVLYDVFGAKDPKVGWKKDLKTKRKTKSTRGTNEKNLQKVGEQHPILLRLTNAILAYREKQKAIGTYFDFSLKNGRLLWALNPFGTDTNRMACTSSSFWSGTQVQNIPDYAKGMLIADEGFFLMEADQSQSDARGTAYLAQDLNLIAALEDKDKDFYKTLGTLFFGIPYEKVSKEFRNAVLKKIVHGTNYMMGAATFIENAGVANLLLGASVLGVKVSLSSKPEIGTVTLKDFATSLLEAYHTAFSRVRPWYSEVKSEIRQTNLLKSPSGHTRYFFGNIDKKYQIFSSAIAHGPQHLTGAVLNQGFWKIWKLQKQYPTQIRMKAQIHDSSLKQIYINYEDNSENTENKENKDNPFIQFTLECMNNPITIHRRTLVIPVDYKLGNSWGNMIEYKVQR